MYIYVCIPGGPIGARPMRAQVGPQGSGPPGPQGTRVAHKGPGGPTRAQPTRTRPARAQGGPQDSRGAHKGPAHMGLVRKGKNLGPPPHPFDSKPDPLMSSAWC